MEQALETQFFQLEEVVWAVIFQSDEPTSDGKCLPSWQGMHAGGELIKDYCHSFQGQQMAVPHQAPFTEFAHRRGSLLTVVRGSVHSTMYSILHLMLRMTKQAQELPNASQFIERKEYAK